MNEEEEYERIKDYRDISGEYCEHQDDWEEINFTWCNEDNRWECPDCYDKHYDHDDLEGG